MKSDYLTGITVITLSSLAITSCFNEKKEQEQSRPNIILIMADDVSPLNFNCYKNKLPIPGIDKMANNLYGNTVPTPNIDKVAANGMIFTQAYAVSAVCTPSRYSILTGQYPGRSTDENFLKSFPRDKEYSTEFNTLLTDTNITLEKVLKKAGYFTGFVGKFHVSNFDFDNYKVNKDFPEIDPNINPYSSKADSLLKIYQQLVAKEVKRILGADFVENAQWENPEELPIKAIQKHHLEWLTQGAIDFLDVAPKDKPFFLHFNSTALHGPNLEESLKSDPHISPSGRMRNPYQYQPTRASIFRRMDSLGLDTSINQKDYIFHYQSGMIYFDDQVGAILKKLKETGRDKNTLIIITADHNTEPGKASLYNKGLRVPFVAQWLSEIPAGSICSQQIQFVDFMPTFAELAQTEIPENAVVDGKSIVPAFQKNTIKRKSLYFEFGYTRAVSNGKYKYIAMRFPKDIIEKTKSGGRQYITNCEKLKLVHPYITMQYQPGFFAADQLYDLEKDPYEQTNLAYNNDYKEVLIKMKADLEQYLLTFKHPFDLNNTGFMDLPVYTKMSVKTRERGTSFISWWNRKLDYPPK